MQREYTNEIMDDFSIGGDRIEQALKELKVINTFLGGNSTSKAGIKLIQEHSSAKSKFTILDAGAGASDVLISLAKKFSTLQIISFDANRHACKFIKRKQPQLNVICGSTENISIKEKSIDVVHASLFLHHFNEADIVKMLQDFSVIAKRAIIINDLHRSFWALIGIKSLTLLFSRSKMVKNDAPLSVKRGFKKNELVEILDQLNYKYMIKRKWAFRWLVVVFLDEDKS